MIEKFRMGVRELAPFYRSFLPEDVLAFLSDLADRPDRGAFAYPDDAWVRTVFHFVLACHRKLVSREHILKSLTPLYLGKVASFVIETWESSAEEVERRLERLCRTFESDKDYLIERWDGKA
jgi:hypothetical protein